MNPPPDAGNAWYRHEHGDRPEERQASGDTAVCVEALRFARTLYADVVRQHVVGGIAAPRIVRDGGTRHRVESVERRR